MLVKAESAPFEGSTLRHSTREQLFIDEIGIFQKSDHLDVSISDIANCGRKLLY
jgi:hypothetical protein